MGRAAAPVTVLAEIAAPCRSTEVARLPTLMLLRDGTPVFVRPLEPGDRMALLGIFDRLSAESRHQRFLAGVGELSERQLGRLTDVDHDGREAWVAFDPGAPGSPAIGVARYARLRGRPDVAEVAVTVVDRYQGRGLGTLLLALVCGSAVAHRITTFRAWVFDSNRVMIRMLRRLGGGIRSADGAVLCIEAPVGPRQAMPRISRIARSSSSIV